MKFVVNTKYNAAGTVVLEGIVVRLKNSIEHTVSRNDFDHYGNYDVAIFMAPDSRLREAKKQNNRLLCGIFDPKVTLLWQKKEVRSADFLIVSSIEQREFFLKYNKNVFIYYMFPDLPEIEKVHICKEKIIIGYHGNKQHLNAMRDLSWALDRLSEKHSVEFHAIYNIKKLGKWNKNLPKKCPVHHVQWTGDSVVNNLAKCDIGVLPSLLPAPSIFARPFVTFLLNKEGYHNNDYVSRYKLTTNPGRLYVFTRAGLPVVSDFTPSSCQFIEDGKSGMLVGTKEGWLNSLEFLMNNFEKREIFAVNLKKTIHEKYSIDKNFIQFLDFIKNGIR